MKTNDEMARDEIDKQARTKSTGRDGDTPGNSIATGVLARRGEPGQGLNNTWQRCSGAEMTDEMACVEARLGKGEVMRRGRDAETRRSHILRAVPLGAKIPAS